MIHHPFIDTLRKKIHTLTEERILAIKITGISFIVLNLIIWVIIGASYFTQKERIYRDFEHEARIFDEGKIGKGIREFLITKMPTEKIIPNLPLHDGEKEGRGPRDIIIFDENNIIIKNDFLEVSEDQAKALLEIEDNIGTAIIGDRSYIIHKKDFGGLTFLMTRDLKDIEEFHEGLMIIALIGNIIGLFIIYYVSLKIAHIVIDPIKRHNENLTSYSHNVAHELKTPLTIMQSNLELLSIMPSESLIHSTQEEVHSMEKIIDTLLFMAHPEKHQEHLSDIDLHSIIKNTIEDYKDQKIHYTGTTHITRGHEELFRRIIVNLIENAQRYGIKDTLSIELSPTHIIFSNAIESIIDPHILSHLTEAFYQGDHSRSTSGHGLGLTLVEKICRVFGWRLVLSSEDHSFRIKILFS